MNDHLQAGVGPNIMEARSLSCLFLCNEMSPLHHYRITDAPSILQILYFSKIWKKEWGLITGASMAVLANSQIMLSIIKFLSLAQCRTLILAATKLKTMKIWFWRLSLTFYKKLAPPKITSQMVFTCLYCLPVCGTKVFAFLAAVISFITYSLWQRSVHEDLGQQLT